MPEIPAHTSPFGSGSHSPVSVQVVKLGPISASPGGQLKLKVVPSTGKTVSSKVTTLGTESLPVDNSPYPQLAGKKTPFYDNTINFPKKTSSIRAIQKMNVRVLKGALSIILYCNNSIVKLIYMAKAPILHAVPYIHTQGVIAHPIGPCQNFHFILL
jgi:hypothetical protein